MDGEPPPPPDFSGLSLADKLAHKVWKAGVAGYEEALTLFKRIDDEKSPEYSKYAGSIKKFVIDSNALAQDKGLDATLVFVDYAAVAAKVANDVVEGVVLKCLNQKPKTKEKGLAICLMFVEIEQAAAVQEELMKGFDNKQPKIVAACVEVLSKCVGAFGPKVMNIKTLMKVLPKLFEHSDKNVREQAKGIATELFRWLRDALKPSLSGLKPVQLKELEDSWASMPADAPRPTRLLRSQQAKAAEAPAAAAAGDDGGDDAAEASAAAVEIDPYDLIEAVAVLDKMPGDFYEKLAEKKWQERKEALDALLEIVSQPKLASANYGELLQALKRVVTKDTNVMLVAIAAKCVALLGIGLRKDFSQYVGLLFTPFIEKFKEKKIGVVTALREALDAMLAVVPMQQHIDDLVGSGLESKNPAVKTETILLMTRSFSKSAPSMVPKPMLKQLCPALMKKFDDTTAQVRDATAECLGTLLKLMGERAMAAYLADLDKSRSAKVTEASEKAEITPPKGAAAPAKKAAPPAAAAASAAPAASEEPKAPAKKRPMLSSERKKVAKPATDDSGEAAASGGAAAKPSEPTASAPPAKKPPVRKAPAASKPSSAKPASAGTASSKPKASGGGGGGAGGPFKEPEGPSEPNIPAEEVDEKAAAAFPADLLQLVESKAWKERLEAYEKWTELLKGTEENHTYLVVKIMAKKPGWKDTNFQVMKAKFEMVSFLAQNKPFGKKSAHCAFPGLVDKLGDIKVKGAAAEALSAIGEALSLNHVSLQVSKLALEHKSPKVQQEALTWLTNALKEFGLAINIKPHIDYIKTCLGATNAGVRSAAIALIGTVFMFLGGQLRMFFEEEKPALLAQIDTEFDKMKDEKPPVPTRGPNAGQEHGSGGGAGGGGGGGGPSLADLMPRNDISGQIKSSLINELGDKQWKVRGEALARIAEIITTAKFITPSLGDLPGALKGRLVDSNKNLVMQTLTILGSIATAMGPAVKKFLPIYGPAVFNVLTDAKPQVRGAAVTCLNAYCDEVKLNVFLEGGYIAGGLATENPNLRAELLTWFEQKLADAGAVCNEVKDTVAPIYSCLEDRNADVRKKAQSILPALLTHIGIEYMVKVTGKLKGSSKASIMTLLEKYKGSAAAAAPAAAAATASSSSSSKPAAKSGAGAGKTVAKGKTGGASSASSRAPAAASASSAASASASSSASAGQSGGDDDEMPLTGHGGKEARTKADRDLKILKWNFPAPRSEHIDQLKDQLTPCVSKKQFTEMFHSDFKHHIIALEALIKIVTPDSSGAVKQKDEVIGSLDLLLKWVTLRFFDTNTSVLMKALNFLDCTFKVLGQQNYHLSEYEATAFIPYLVLKVGDAKEPVRKAVRSLFNLVCDIYPASKMYVHISDGTHSKNSRQRIECLEELACLIERHTLNICQPSVPKAVSALSSHISDRDNSVRSAALNALVGVYAQLEEPAFWKYMGNVSEKEKSLLEERIKRSGKKPLSAAGAAGGGAATSAAATSKVVQAGASKLPSAAGAHPEKKTLGGLRAPQSRSTAAAPSTTAPAATASAAAAAAAVAACPASSEPLGVVRGKFFSIDVSGPEYTVDPNSVPPVALTTIDDLDQLVAPYSVPARLSDRLGSRLQMISSSTIPSSTSHILTTPRPVQTPTALATSAATTAVSSVPSARAREPSEAVRSMGMPSSASSTMSSVPSSSTRPMSSVASSGARPVTANAPPSSLDTLLKQITSAQLATALQSLRELESQIQIKDVIEALAERVDDLLLALAQQLQIACSIHALRSSGGSPEELIRLLKYILHLQVQILQQPTLAKAISRRGLTQLLWQLLGTVKDESLFALPDVAQLHRTVNILFVKYFEACRPNETLGSVIELLSQCCQEGSSRANLTEIVLKCLWRLTRMLDQLLETCQLDRLFLDLNNFLVMHPSSVWRQRANNLPLRSIKTIIHHVAEKVGPKAMQHLTLVENADGSELSLFLQKKLMAGGGGGSGSTAKPATAVPAPVDQTDGGESRARAPLLSSSRENVSPPPTSQQPTKPSSSHGSTSGSSIVALSSSSTPSSSSAGTATKKFRPLSSDARRHLANIVSKIGDRENSQRGLQELYDFAQSHPDADVAPYFELCSPEFRNFVDKSLRNIARQRAREAKADGSSAADLQENLQSLRSLLPVTSPASSVSKPTPATSTAAAPTGEAAPATSIPGAGASQSIGKSNQQTLEDFRKRLDRIRDTSSPNA